jgi:Ca2+-binding EF-hand superfamily protein
MDTATFNRFDLDQDGFITREEAAGSALANRFDELDRNHDGRLSPSELRAGVAGGGSSASGYSGTAVARAARRMPAISR